MQKGQTGIFILMGVLILVSVAGGAYYLGRRAVKPQDSKCTLVAKLCPDGSSVGRTGPNCEFAQCPVDASGVPIGDVEIANWKTYTNTKAKYSFSYPPHWPLKRSTQLLPQNVEALYFNTNDQSNSADYTIAVIEISRGSIDEYIKDNTSIIDIKNANISGQQAISYRRSSGMPQLPIIEYAVERDDFIYIIRLLDSDETNKNREKNLRIFNQLLDTFKFLE